MSEITLTKFIAQLKAGERYEGNVKDLGQVTWIAETVYFAKVYKLYNALSPILGDLDFASEKAAIDNYKRRGGNKHVTTRFVWKELNDLNIWQYKSTFEIKTKKKYRIIILPNLNIDADFSYTDSHLEHAGIRDNTTISDRYLHKTLSKIEGFLHNEFDKKAVAHLSVLNNAMDTYGVSAALDVLDEFDLTPKSVGWFTDILSCISIIDDLDEGDYINAAGKVFEFTVEKGLGKIGFGWVSTAISIGTLIYETDNMQRQLARGYAIEYKELVNKINLLDYYTPAKKRNHEYQRKRNELIDELIICEKNFMRCMDNLRIEVTDRRQRR
jgi:hypothetical protein